MNSQYKEIKNKYEELEKQLQDPALISNTEKYTQVSQEFSEYKEVYDQIKRLEKIKDAMKDAHESLKEKELKELAEQELIDLENEKQELEAKIKEFLKPKDPNDKKNVIMEIRAGAGGDESALFAADLFRMYSRFAERNHWKVEIINSNTTEIGGFKEIIFGISGQNVFGTLKQESGVHRVQRIPVTESGGRIHTSTVTVAILPEAEEIEMEINSNDIKIDRFRSTGPGGQSVNTTDSAVRVTHLPTGIVVTCQDEKSQHKNKDKALKVLRARLLDRLQREQNQKIDKQRKKQVGTGDRSERIRTYNFPQNRVTDHRISKNFHNLEEMLDGNLDDIVASFKESQ